MLKSLRYHFVTPPVRASKLPSMTPTYTSATLRADGGQPAPGLLQRAAGGAGGAGAGGGVRGLGARDQGGHHQALWLVSAPEDGGRPGEQGEARVLAIHIPHNYPCID